ncbi:MAG: hypothetical protein FJ403_14440 [Verrucomicrobia bacterium]|nr:hypothetical protein [Verrucomicrobiota bacterium]
MDNEPATVGLEHFGELETYPLLAALRNRRSRRFAKGMKMDSGPLAFTSRFKPAPLTEAEEAALAFAATGITAYALADLCFAKGQGGNMMAGLIGRTIASGDGVQAVALAVINDDAAYLIKRPRDLSAREVTEFIDSNKRGAFTETYRRSRMKIKDGRVAPSVNPLFNVPINRWSAHALGTTCFCRSVI